jgi:hypothetical protein
MLSKETKNEGTEDDNHQNSQHNYFQFLLHDILEFQTMHACSLLVDECVRSCILS